MGFDYFTIRNLAAELSGRLGERVFGRAESTATQIGIEVAGGGHLLAEFGRRGWLRWSAEALPGSVGDQRSPEPFLCGARVLRVWSDPRDRMLWLRLVRGDSAGEPSYGLLVFELIHPSFQAYLCSERSGIVLRRWGGDGRLRLGAGMGYVPPPGTPRLLPGIDAVDDFVAAWPGKPDNRRSLAILLVGMDELVAGEVLARAGLGPDAPLAETDLRALWAVVVGLFTRPAEPGGFLWTSAGETLFSGLAPATAEVRALQSMSEAIRLGTVERSARKPPSHDPGVRNLRVAAARLQRRLCALESDLALAATADHLQRQAAVILANLARIPRGATRVALPDPYSPDGAPTAVDLDPKRTPADQAASLAKVAQRYRRRQETLPKRIGEVRILLEEARRMQAQPTPTAEAIDLWLKKNGMQRNADDRRAQSGTEAHPRRYRTSAGWSVWAGRNNTENDLLSHRLAAQNDYWFHAHGYPGSHVVLRREGRKEEPSSQTLREAAGVAAFWSKGKTAKKVAVVYTLVKYVSKPRGGAPGQALLKREKSIMVEPKLLPEEDQA